MITLNAFLAAIQENIARITHYELGGDGSNGGCDCIGLIIGAVKLAGGKWTGLHGSNYAARNEILDLHLITKGDYFTGEVVFKAREPGDAKYDLPDRYKSSGDLRDYYHVGVVTSINPLQITHCTGVPGGIKDDNQPGQWKYGGQLKMVDYDIDVMYEAVVTAPSGGSVNMRKKPSLTADKIEAVPVGKTVSVLQEVGEWSRIQYNGRIGYMMDQYLIIPDLGGLDEVIQILTEAKEDLLRLKAKIDLAVETLKIGGGVG